MALVEPALMNEVICEWKIDNFVFFPNEEELHSPFFYLNPGDESTSSKWFLILYPKYKSKTVSIYLHRHIEGPETIKLCYEISIIAVDGSSRKMHSSPLQFSFKREARGDVIENCVYEMDANTFMVNLSFRCRLWGVGVTYPMYWLIRTRNKKIQKWYIKWNIDRFSSLKKEKVLVHSSDDAEDYFRFQVSWSGDGLSDKIEIEINPIEQQDRYAICKISLLDVDGNVAASKEDTFCFEEQDVWIFPPFITKEWLLNNKDLCLSNDTLSLSFEVTVLGNEYDFYRVEEIHFGGHCNSSFTPGYSTNTVKRSSTSRSYTEGNEKVNFDVASDCISPVDPSGNNFNMPPHVSDTLMKGLLSLFQHRKFCDVTLKTAKSSFPVHKAVLCAQSARFSTMFEQEMKENRSGIVEIPDLDDDTIQSMLMFMYTGDLKDMQWDSAQKLYIASDKYEVAHLKNSCRGFLQINLSVSNVIEALLLADLHQDPDLKSVSLDFVYEHDGELLYSDLWKTFMQENPKFAAELMHLLYIRKIKI